MPNKTVKITIGNTELIYRVFGYAKNPGHPKKQKPKNKNNNNSLCFLYANNKNITKKPKIAR
jgi:hypothetical protein